MAPLLALVGAAGALYCVVLGVKFAKAEESRRSVRRPRARSKTRSSASF